MLKPYDPAENKPVPPECAATVALIQRALDGEPADLEADPHPAACPACRERVRAARALLSVFAAPEPVAVPEGFADRVVMAAQEERLARTRHNVYKAAAALALAAAVLLAVFAIFYKPQSPVPMPLPRPPVETAKPPEVAPAPREKAPEPRPIRIGDEVAKASQTLLEAPKPLADSVAVAPKLLDALTGSFKMPAKPADPMGAALEPARKSLVELPAAARAGLEPVTDTAEKALARFLADMGAVKPN